MECFHCGLAVDARAPFQVEVDGRLRPVCCAGCEAVSRAILGQGLGEYYRLRERPADSASGNADAEAGLALYDEPAVQQAFVRDAQGAREAVLLLEGIRCAACAWLVEQVLARLPGVLAAEVNYATRRIQLRWDPAALRLSDALRAVLRVGYRASPYDPHRTEPLERAERRDALWRLFVAGFGMMQVMMYAFPAYIAEAGELSADIDQLLRWASFVLTVPVVAYSAAPFFAGAWRALAARHASMDLPVALGIALAFGASVAATLRGSGEVYYDSVAMFVLALLAGRFLELVARQRAAAALQHLARLVPEGAHRLPDFPASAQSERVPAVALRPGDFALVKPGERFPADGVVASGTGAVSEALLSGESTPIAKSPGSPVVGGSVNLAGPIVIEVRKVGAETVLSSVLALVDRAAAEKPRLAQVADRTASAFISMVIVLAALAWLYWTAVEPERALLVALAVLVATCPCALSLATPAALTAATGALARRGLVIGRGHAIEALASVTDWVFDKTGTLTLGEFVLAQVHACGRLSRSQCLDLAASIEAQSEHPIARAFARAEGANAGLPVEQATHVPGSGIEARVQGRRYRLGRYAFACTLAPAPAAACEAAHETDVWLWGESGPLAVFLLADALRPGVREAVAGLGALGIRVHLLSGDGERACRAMASAAGISRVRAEASPEGKLVYLRELRSGGARVAMVGDGVNDAPVLCAADVSLAMSSGTRLAQVRADAVLLCERVESLPEIARYARRTMRVIRQNIAWAFCYNLAVLPLALAGVLSPWAAALGMSASSVLVVANAVRLQRGVA